MMENKLTKGKLKYDFETKIKNLAHGYFKMRLCPKHKKSREAVIYCEVKMKNDVSLPFSTSIKCSPSEWDYKTNRIKESTDIDKEKNLHLDFIDSEIRRCSRELISKDKEINSKILREIIIEKPKKKPTYLEMFTNYIEYKKALKRKESTILSTNIHKKIFTDFLNSLNKSDITLIEINNTFVDKLCTYLNNKSLSNGFFNNAMYSFGAVLQRAIYLGHETNGNPFKLIERKKLYNKEFLYLNTEQLENLLKTQLYSDELQNSLNAFLFQCFTGVAICDLKNFKKSIHIVNDSIVINRLKNNMPCYIPIVRQAREILERLETDSFEILTDYIYNNHIRIFATICNHPQSHLFTSHAGRKTYGMFMLTNNIRMETVSRVLGHSDIRVTQKIYTRIFNKDIDRDFVHMI